MARKHAIRAAVLGVLTFGVVAVAVTAALDPYIWPSAIVGLPAGAAAGLLAWFLSRRSRRTTDAGAE